MALTKTELTIGTWTKIEDNDCYVGNFNGGEGGAGPIIFIDFGVVGVSEPTGDPVHVPFLKNNQDRNVYLGQPVWVYSYSACIVTHELL